MRFFPPSDEPVLIALTSGHTAVVRPEGSELDARFQADAIKLGCRVDGLATPEPDAPLLTPFDPKAVIRQVIEAMLDGATKDDFTQDGKPSLKVVKERCGFNVSREECDAVWADITREAA